MLLSFLTSFVSCTSRQWSGRDTSPESPWSLHRDLQAGSGRRPCQSCPRSVRVRISCLVVMFTVFQSHCGCPLWRRSARVWSLTKVWPARGAVDPKPGSSQGPRAAGKRQVGASCCHPEPPWKGLALLSGRGCPACGWPRGRTTEGTWVSPWLSSSSWASPTARAALEVAGV